MATSNLHLNAIATLSVADDHNLYAILRYNLKTKQLTEVLKVYGEDVDDAVDLCLEHSQKRRLRDAAYKVCKGEDALKGRGTMVRVMRTEDGWTAGWNDEAGQTQLRTLTA